MHFIYYKKWINSHESRFNLFALLTNSTQCICLVTSGGRETVTFSSQSPTLSRYRSHIVRAPAEADISCVVYYLSPAHHIWTIHTYTDFNWLY